MNNVASKQYNDSLTVSDFARQEALAPNVLHLLTYEKSASTCEGFESGKLANMNSSFPHTVLGHLWKSTEYLYLCGEWSNDTAEHLAIQQDVLTATSGYAAKRYKKSKHKRKPHPLPLPADPPPPPPCEGGERSLRLIKCPQRL